MGSSLSKSVPQPPEGPKSEKDEGNSFRVTIAALESRGGSTEITEPEAEETVEELDELMRKIQDEGEKNYCLRVLAEVCCKHAVLPRTYMVSDVELGGKRELGGVADIWTGKLGQNDVCIKTFRLQNGEDEPKIKGAFYRLAARWKNFSHPNVLPFLGVYESEIASLGLITPWMSNNIKDYTRGRQSDDILRLLAETACGLKYLHSLEIVHGGVKPGNVLITRQGTACVGDFGIADIIDNPNVAVQGGTPSRQYGGIRYMAPEQLDEGVIRKESDIHSFAFTAYEVLIGVEPYPGVNGGGPLSAKIMSGLRPSRKEDETPALSDDIWRMLESCWTPEPSLRPTMVEVHRAFQGPNATVDSLAPGDVSPEIAPSDPPHVETTQVTAMPPAKGKFMGWLRDLRRCHKEGPKRNGPN